MTLLTGHRLIQRWQRTWWMAESKTFKTMQFVQCSLSVSRRIPTKGLMLPVYVRWSTCNLIVKEVQKCNLWILIKNKISWEPFCSQLVIYHLRQGIKIWSSLKLKTWEESLPWHQIEGANKMYLKEINDLQAEEVFRKKKWRAIKNKTSLNLTHLIYCSFTDCWSL